MAIQFFLKALLSSTCLLSLTLILAACGGDFDADPANSGIGDAGATDGGATDGGATGGGTTDGGETGLHDAFSQFASENVSMYLDLR